LSNLLHLLLQEALACIYPVDTTYFHGNTILIGIDQQPVPPFPPLQLPENGPTPTYMDQSHGHRLGRIFGDAMEVQLKIGAWRSLSPMQPALSPLAVKRDTQAHARGMTMPRQTDGSSIFVFQGCGEAQNWMHLLPAGQVQIHYGC